MTDPLEHYVEQVQKIKPLNKPRSHGVSFQQIMQKNAKARGLTPLPLEDDLLLSRVRQGGQSGRFLGMAFISAYDMSNFNESLGEIVNLDAEGFRLFHEILHIRFIKSWTDARYNALANEIEKLLDLPY